MQTETKPILNILADSLRRSEPPEDTEDIPDTIRTPSYELDLIVDNHFTTFRVYDQPTATGPQLVSLIRETYPAYHVVIIH